MDSSVSKIDSGEARAADYFNPRVDALRRLTKNKTAIAGLIVFIIIVMSCICAPLLTKHTYYELNIDLVRATPSREHILGTDNLGRDMLARILYGGRMTLKIAFVSTILAAIFGSIVGLLSGYFGRRTDFVLSHILDMIASIPVYLLVIVAETAIGWSRGNFMYALALAAVPQFARLVRASVITTMGYEYIEAARALGVSHIMIIIRHIFRSVAPQLIVRFTSGVAEALIICSIIGYLGIGISPPTPEWGLLAFIGRAYIRTTPLLMGLPCAAITLSVISLSLFGDGLRDVLDPREQALSAVQK